MKLSKKLAIQILNELLKTGADYAEIYYQDNIKASYVRRYKKVYSFSKKHINGVGLRLLKDNETVYGYTSDLSSKNLLNLANKLSLGFSSKRVLEVSELKEEKLKNIIPTIVSHSSIDNEKKFAYLKKGEDAAFSISKQVSDVLTSLYEEDEHVEIYNSEGKMFKDDRVRTRASVQVIASDGSQFQNAFESLGLSKGLELLDEFDIVSVSKKQAQIALDLLTAKDGPSGELPVVIGNGFGGVLFHEACGHPLEGSSISHQTSPFAKMYGKKIATDIVTAIDDGTILNAWGSSNIDDEGLKPTKNYLITNGVLTNYMVDRYTSRRIENSTPTGSCRRQSYKFVPTTRMTNTYIDNGTSTKEEIIKSVKYGIYLESFTGGQVDPSTDQFLFTSTVAYVIKDGKISHMIKPVSLTGYGYEILNRITMIANDLQRAAGNCGASSGMCEVEVGQPTLLVSKILVGGKGE